MRHLLLILAGVLVLRGEEKLVGIYIHQHWSYNHPYAARTWSLDDWRGYADGIRRLGYNAVMIWPVLETVPDPPTRSDRAHLDKMSRVIDMLHRDFGMKVHIALCPNVVPNADAAKSGFEKRRFFYTDLRVNPSDPTAMSAMLGARERLLRPLARADAVNIIDSDPGGYPGSTNREFVDLLVAHRGLLDRLRPGIELNYWVHAGWPAYGRFYATGEFKPGTEPEFLEAFQLLAKANPAPWGLAGGLRFAAKVGLTDRVLSLNYGRIEGEPSFPMTNFGGDRAWEGGRDMGPRGVIGNAQTHCVQLPNTFAFARGARGMPVTDKDYEEFANDLIAGQGSLILNGWKTLSGSSPDAMRQAASAIEAVPRSGLKAGPLRGLLFGSPSRFLSDLVFQLRVRAAAEELYSNPTPRRLAEFAEAAGRWQKQHGYENRWFWQPLYEALAKFDSPEIRDALEPPIAEKGFDKVRRHYYLRETMTPRMLAAMRTAAARPRQGSR
jgi:hypothetical protein